MTFAGLATPPGIGIMSVTPQSMLKNIVRLELLVT